MDYSTDREYYVINSATTTETSVIAVFNIAANTFTQIKIDNNEKNPTISKFIAYNNTLMFASANNIIYVSYDNGKTFHKQEFQSKIKNVIIYPKLKDKIIIYDSQKTVFLLKTSCDIL